MRNPEFSDLIFSLPFPLAVCDREGRVFFFNQKFEMFLNRSKKYIEGKKLKEIISEEIDKWIKKCVDEGLEIHNIEIGDFLFTLSPFFRGEKIKGAVVVIEKRREVIGTEHFDVFLKGISHELRNPLSGMKASAKLMLQLKEFDEELVEVVVSEINRIERFLDRICESFDFSRLKWCRYNIHKLLNDVLKAFKTVFEKERIIVEQRFDPSLPEVSIDRDRMFQVFSNILKNSVEAFEGDKDRKIVVETGYAIQPKGFIFVKVKDNGKGMDRKELENLFTPFFTAGKEKGTGLGMYISREIVLNHGGKIDVQSEKGKGTTVTVYLPIGETGKYGTNSYS
ncbi:two-component system sensor histidine kinase NtrB [Desulfurobacterium atlanticum]|uniref:histidine kinase n=1 Tax=Desulfurobacterium atlanticum TaxID=240169 RepID=A0A238Z8Y2_9BACT|nr:ATP-binding protein [Desulfurobacterium atlanticum]SNR79431.1 two-component system, NtrC family, nitrogen regulation sensor histidine kinase GlnL [Desulfurobacterium atlanticum]